jgi:23S rRNA (uracil1939-C5)-methyltransferase
MRREPEIVDVFIHDFSLKGYGVALLPRGQEVEVAHSVPGDQVRIEWRKKKHPPQKGRLLEVLTSSKDRVIPQCLHVGVCGGCSWQQMDYFAQLKEKERRVAKAFGNNFPVDPILPCEKIFAYRNKMEFSFSQNRGGDRYLGLMIAQAEPYVFNVTECHLCSSWFTEALTAVRHWWSESKLQAYCPPLDTGTLRYLTLRESFRSGRKMAILNVSGRAEFAPSRADLDRFVAALQQGKDPISIFLRIHQANKGRPTQFYEMHLYGPDHIVETLHLKGGDLSFKISPISFFQPNTLQAEKLYDLALEMLGEAPSVVYDLYAGTGTLGMAASRFAKQVIGIELSPEAVLDAEENIKRNGIQNIRMVQGDVGEVITRLMNSSEFLPPDAILVDPPRAGLDPLAVHHLKTLLPRVIVYISCNPLTQAANVKELMHAGYRLKRLQPVDQFPHTYHIENIALLER